MAPDFPNIRLCRHVLCGLTDEAIAATMCGFNELRGLWIIAESFPDLANGDFKDGVADKGPGPNSVEQIILGGEPVVERRSRDTRFRGDVGEVEPGVALTAEDLERRLEDPRPG